MRTLPIHNETAWETLPKGLYISFFHGRDTVDEDMDDWGYDGPTVGPLRWWHTTYTFNMRGEFVNKEDAVFYTDAGVMEKIKCYNSTVEHYNECFEFVTKEDMALIGGKYYGDWSVYYNAEGL
jgi:hypothetical protein